MSEGGAKVFEKTKEIDDAVVLYVDKQVYEGWEDVKITREINAAASDFQLQLVDKWRPDKEPWRLVPGQHVHLHAGGKSMTTGYIDRVESSVSAGSRKVTITGRSKTGDLVDCATEVDGAQLSGLTLSELVRKVIAPFGISARFLAASGDPLAKFTLSPGETAFNVLDRACKQRKVILYPDVEGNLVIAQGGAEGRADTELRQGVNVLSGKSTYDFSNRFSKYITKGQNLAWLGEADNSVQTKGDASDSAVTRYRPHVINNDQSGDDPTMANRAEYERELRAAQSLEVEVEVQGWFQESGKLWDVNQFVRVDVGFLGVRRQMLIKKVDFNKGGGGTTATLTLGLEDSFNFVGKNKKKEADMGWTKLL